MKETKNLKLKTKNFGIKLFLLGLVTSVYFIFKPKKTSDDMRKMEFSTSTQKLGVSFTEKVRNMFRNRWVKKV
jgi:hypothetical protein